MGIAPTKTLAKLANRLKRRHGTTGAGGRGQPAVASSAHRSLRYTTGWHERWELR